MRVLCKRRLTCIGYGRIFLFLFLLFFLVAFGAIVFSDRITIVFGSVDEGKFKLKLERTYPKNPHPLAHCVGAVCLSEFIFVVELVLYKERNKNVQKRELYTIKYKWVLWLLSFELGLNLNDENFFFVFVLVEHVIDHVLYHSDTWYGTCVNSGRVLDVIRILRMRGRPPIIFVRSALVNPTAPAQSIV